MIFWIICIVRIDYIYLVCHSGYKFFESIDIGLWKERVHEWFEVIWIKMKSSHNQDLFDKQVGLESLSTVLYCVPHCDEMTKYTQRERKQMMKFSFLEVFH